MEYRINDRHETQKADIVRVTAQYLLSTRGLVVGGGVEGSVGSMVRCKSYSNS